jgi:hypothetical protein
MGLPGMKKVVGLTFADKGQLLTNGWLQVEYFNIHMRKYLTS